MNNMENSPFSAKRYIGRYPGSQVPKYFSSAEEGAASVQKKHILVIDDDPFFRSLFKVTLGQTGCPIGEIWEAEDSGRALGIFNTQALDMVFCDFNLPAFSSQNGVETIRQLRHIRPNIPVYMVTAENSVELILRVRAVGATGHLLKPINLRTLKKIVLTLDETASSGSPVPVAAIAS